MKRPVLVEFTVKEIRAAMLALWLAPRGNKAYFDSQDGEAWNALYDKFHAILYVRGNYKQVSETLKAKWTPEKRAEASRRAKEQHARMKRKANQEMYPRP